MDVEVVDSSRDSIVHSGGTVSSLLVCGEGCSRFCSATFGGMYQNHLQELAQRSCFNLPAYACIREGPDHAPRFKATVIFNGELFESPNYCSTLRQAEHVAAEVALNILSRRSSSQPLAARFFDETGVCKNLLQETAQRAGVSLPTLLLDLDLGICLSSHARWR